MLTRVFYIAFVVITLAISTVMLTLPTRHSPNVTTISLFSTPPGTFNIALAPSVTRLLSLAGNQASLGLKSRL